MNVQELYRRYPKIDQIISVANENRESAPELARICDFITSLCVDLIDNLPSPPVQVARFDPFTGQPLAPPSPEPAQSPKFDPYTGQPLAPVARFDPYTGQPLASPAPAAAPAQWTPPVGTPGLSQGWPQPNIPA